MTNYPWFSIDNSENPPYLCLFKVRYFFSQIQKYIIMKLPIFLTLDEAKNWLRWASCSERLLGRGYPRQ